LWTKEKKITQISEEDEELQCLLQQRTDYLVQLQSNVFEPGTCVSPSITDDSESSDEELDHPSQVHIKTEPSEHEIDMKQNDKCHTEEDVKLNINIKQEIIDEKIDCKEMNDVEDTELDEQIMKGIKVVQEEMKNIAKERNEAEEKSDEDNSDQDERTELKFDVNIRQQQGSCKEEMNSNISGMIRPIVRRQHEKRSKRAIAIENDQMSQMDPRKQIKIKQEPTEYLVDLDSLEEDMVDDIKRGLRPRKLNDTHIYFEPYDGSSSEESDFTDLSE